MQTATATQPKERGIIFSGDNPKLILEGRKTQTRRIVKPQPIPQHHIAYIGHGEVGSGFAILTNHASTVERISCPYGVAGDRLYVKEKFFINGDRTYYHDNADGSVKVCFTSPRSMPRERSRITLEITKVRVERLQDISMKDVRAEGAVYNYNHPQRGYRDLWNKLHGKGAWDKNPWVWVVDLKRIKDAIKTQSPEA